MSDLLAIVGPMESDEELLEEIAYARPDRVTVLVETTTPDWGVGRVRAGPGRS